MLFFVPILFVISLFVGCENFTEDIELLNEQIENLTTELKSLISDNTNSINSNAALIDQITNDVLDNESSSASLNDLVAGLGPRLILLSQVC